jgi:hypothetical protein
MGYEQLVATWIGINWTGFIATKAVIFINESEPPRT